MPLFRTVSGAISSELALLLLMLYSVMSLCMQDLPAAAPVQCVGPGDMFGNCMFVLEYLTCFKPLFNFEFPSDLTVGRLTWSICNYCAIFTRPNTLLLHPLAD